MAVLQKRIDSIEIDMPPMNVSLDDVIRGLKYAGIEVPSGIRGRLSIWGALIEEADAAIVMEEAPFSFGCVGCERSGLMVKYLIKRRGIPVLNAIYPKTEEEGKYFVAETKRFLESLDAKRVKVKQ
ncbi:MAG: methanogenesis marker 5 protein, partial [archaeon]|nr:methanogenesis marker 5 protein [archaeon]